ncbi:unnamed protein product [Aphanomyces euteiches]|uniref:Uncharacterized protein n=1 Tax=Aphanomyces euteiches TaxID=100861 RepID=A0A6G0XB19_9STRA|nr:hypothetical protein Ae201684_006506 [Aphanomyces euteiches]KAH9090995.1 hypothetical protein Ae201684P_006396 [Aphanomyces euteiches]KAH9156187.1 hypothetical protein AeRB84_001907 [Aphanomyces euteiches]
METVDRPWWRQERRHLPPAKARYDELVERRHVLPVVHPVIDHFANIKPKVPPIPKEPHPEGVKRIVMPPVVEDRPRGISVEINANNFVPGKPVIRYKCTSPHPNAIAQAQRENLAKLEKRMGTKVPRAVVEERNLLPVCSMGDKAYKRPECSPGFFHLQLHPRCLNNNALESPRQHHIDARASDHARIHTSYEAKKKIHMLLEEKQGVTLLSTSKAGQLSWEETTGKRTWTKKESAAHHDNRHEDEGG